MKRPFQKKIRPEKTEKPLVKKETSLTDADYNRKKLFKKGVNLMADEKLEDAAIVFEQVLRIDPDNVDALLKLGYARFHLDDHLDALRVYDKILDIDVTNAEAWNLKALVHYEQKNYAKALDSVEKSIESEPTFGMAWYNKACFLSLLNQIPESIEALKRAIEIVVKHQKQQGFSKIDTYDLTPEMAKKVGAEKRGLLGITQKRLPTTIKNLKEISQAIQTVKSSIEEEDIEKTIDNFDLFIDSTKYGQQMIDQFFESHREIRLWKIRLKDRGIDYLHENKKKMLDVFDDIEATV